MTGILTVMPHYSVIRLGNGDPDAAREELRTLFPDGEADEMNIAVFSTSGVHGTYTTIEEVEAGLGHDPKSDEYQGDTITLTVYHPRIVCLKWGNVRVTAQDIPWLKRLRETSWKAFASIGAA